MFVLKNAEPTQLDNEIERLLNLMSDENPETEEYAKKVEQLSKLYKLKEIEGSRRVSPDTLATVIANLLGIAMILKYEKFHVVTSKATGFVLRAIK